MKQNIIAAGIIALGLMVAAFLFTGRYYLVRLGDEKMARLDRWTGTVKVYDCSRKWWSSAGTCGDVSRGRAIAGETMNVDENLGDLNAASNAAVNDAAKTMSAQGNSN